MISIGRPLTYAGHDGDVCAHAEEEATGSATASNRTAAEEKVRAERAEMVRVRKEEARLVDMLGLRWLVLKSVGREWESPLVVGPID